MSEPAKMPYKGLQPYQETDRDNFFGREDECLILSDQILANRLTLLFAASGVGKSSLLNAAVLPRLKDPKGENLAVCAYRDWVTPPVAGLKAAVLTALKAQNHLSADYPAGGFDDLTLADFLKLFCPLLPRTPLVLVLDQFEEFFQYQHGADAESFISQLSALVMAPEVALVIAIREDFALELNAFKPFLAKRLFENFFRLERLSQAQAHAAIVNPIKSTGWRYQKTLLEALLADLSTPDRLRGNTPVAEVANTVEPAYLQIVCAELWQRETETLPASPESILQSPVPPFGKGGLGGIFKTLALKIPSPPLQRGETKREAGREEIKSLLRLATYEKHGRAQGLVTAYVHRLLGGFTAPQQRIASKAFDHLVSRRGTKLAITAADLADRIRESPDAVSEVLQKLTRGRVLRDQERRNRDQRKERWYELYHDLFSGIVEDWNNRYRARQRAYRGVLWGIKVVVVTAMLYAGYDGVINFTRHHLRLSAKTALSDHIELWQGQPGSYDFFGQQRFRRETGFVHRQLEADKVFTLRPVAEIQHLSHELIGRLPLDERINAYLRAGELAPALRLAEDALVSNRLDLVAETARHLAAARMPAALALLEQRLAAVKRPELKQKLIESLHLVAAPQRGLPLLLEGTEGVNKDVRKIAQDSLKMVLERVASVGSEAAVERLIAMLDEENSGVREDAIELLGELKIVEVIPKLVGFLEDEDSLVRRAAVEALRKLEAAEAVPALMRLLKNRNSNVRQAAAAVLGKLEAAEAVQELIPLLKDEASWVRQTVVGALGELQAAEVVPELIALLNNEGTKNHLDMLAIFGADTIRHITIRVLGSLQAHEAIPELILLLKDNDSKIRRNAVEALGQLKAYEAVPELITRLKDSNNMVRQSAAKALGQLHASEAVADLIALLNDEDIEVCQSAADALGELQASEAILDLITLLKDKNSSDCRVVVDVFGKFRAAEVVSKWIMIFKSHNLQMTNDVLGKFHATEAVQELIALLQNKDSNIRWSAVVAIGSLHGTEAIPAVIALLKDENNWVRQNAAWTLGRLHATEAIPEMITLLQDEDRGVRWTAVTTLGQLQAVEAVPELIALLQDGDNEIRRGAVKALGMLQAVKTIPKLIALLRDKNNNIRQTAVEALWQLQAAEAIPKLIDLLRDKNNNVRQSAVEALGQLQAVKAIPELIALLRDKNNGVRQSAVEALGQLQAAETEQELIALLDDEDSWIRQSAVKILMQLKAAKAAPELIILLKDSEWQVRLSTINALKSLKTRTAIPTLTRLLQDARREVRAAAIDALVALQGREAIPHLIPLLRDKNDLAQPAARALFKLSSYAGVHRLAPYRDSEDAELLWWHLPDDRLPPELCGKDLATLQTELAQLTRQKAAWRAWRDQDSADTEAPDYPLYREADLGYAIAWIDPQQAGPALLAHPLAGVRQGAWPALGSRCRMLDDYETLPAKLVALRDRDSSALTRYAAYRALDHCLMTLEAVGDDADLRILQNLQTEDPAVRERLAWTMEQIEFRAGEQMVDLSEILPQSGSRSSARNYPPRVIDDQDIPPGMRRISTPFGDRLVPAD